MRSIPTLATLVISLAAAGCGGGQQPGDVQMALTGVDGLQLFDNTITADAKPAPGGNPHKIVSAVVTVKEIDAHTKNKWVTIMSTPEQVDLLTLDHKTLSTLGIAQLPKNVKVTELRMKLDSKNAYVVLADGSKHPLEVPGTVKIEGKIELDDCSAGTIIVDFDPRIRVEQWCNHKTVYELACVAHIKTCDVKNACGGGGGSGGSAGTGGTGGGGTGGTGGGGAGGMGGSGGSGGGTGDACNGTCNPDELCSNGACVPDPRCTNVQCAGNEVCSAGNCIPDPCFNVQCDGNLMCVNGHCI